jgi:hypothetical protein
MNEFNYKHYVRVNKDNFILRVFSSGFEQPLEGDILYRESDERHFNLDVFDSNFQLKYKYDNGIIREATEEEKFNLDEYKENKINELNINCHNKIIKGFLSNADGTEKLYDFEEENQANITGKLTLINTMKEVGTPLTTIQYYAKGCQCTDYTIEQFIKLCLDADNHKTSLIQKYKIAKESIMNSNTKKEIDDIIEQND